MPWPTMRAFLHDKLPDHVDVDETAAFEHPVDDHGRSWNGDEPYRPHTFVHFHRELREEPEVPFELTVLHEDERIVVVDKPHFLASIPRGRHVTQSVVVKARAMLDEPTLVPVHRLDRLTAGVLLLTREPRWRAAYQGIFEARQVSKTYEAVAAYDPSLELPRRVESHIRKQHGLAQAFEVPGAPVNAITDIELGQVRGDVATYRLTPATGRTHQLRLHLNGLGIPIVGDPLYPHVRLDDDIDDFTRPLQLLAKTLAFVDPVDGTPRHFTSARTLTWPDGTAAPSPA